MIRRHGQSGFTLLEVIIAFAMLALVLVTFLGMYTAGHQYVFDSGITSSQVYNAQTELDKEVAGVAGGSAVQGGTPTITFTNAAGTVTVFTAPMRQMEVDTGSETILEVYLPQ